MHVGCCRRSMKSRRHDLPARHVTLGAWLARPCNVRSVPRAAADRRSGARTPRAGARIGLAAMSSTAPAWTVVGVLLAVAALAVLVRRFRQGDRASRWLAITAAAWGAAFAAQGAGAGAVMPAAIQLTLTDLLALLGLPALGLGLLRLARESRGEANVRMDSFSRGWGSGQITDGCLVALSAFIIGWIALLRHAYVVTGVEIGSFIVDLIHPAADLAMLAGTLWLATQAGRRGITPYLALAAATLGDFAAVQARASALHPGILSQLSWLVAIALLGLSAQLPGSAASDRSAEVMAGAAEPPLTTLIALTAASLAAAVSLIFGALTWGHSSLLVIAGGTLVLALIMRITGLLRQ